MISSTTRPEVRPQHNFKFDIGASTLDAPPPSWEAQRPAGIELPSRSPASDVDLRCRALECRHVCTVANAPSTLCSPLLSPGFLVSIFILFGHLGYFFYRNRNYFKFFSRLRFSILFKPSVLRLQQVGCCTSP